MKLFKKNIYIPIEIFYREINSRILIALTAAEKGFRVYLGTKAGIDQLLSQKVSLKKRAGIYLYKSQIISNPTYIEKVKKTCEEFVVIDEELGPGLINIKENIMRRTVNEKNISIFFVIGKKIKTKVLEYKKKFNSEIFISGWPKYDLYRKKFSKLYKTESLQIKKKHGKFILIISNFAAISNEGLKLHTKNLKKKIKIGNKEISLNQDIETLTKYYKDYQNFIKNFKIYLDNNKKKNFIIRPHPSDYFHSIWREEFKDYENIKIIYDNDIVPWIKASEAIIHRGCSTSIDAVLLRKKSYFYLPNRKLSNKEKNLTYFISKKIKNFEEIDIKFDNKKIFTKNFYKKIKDEIFNPKNITSSELIVNKLRKLNISNETKHDFFYPIRDVKEYVNFIMKKINIKSDLYSKKSLNKFPNIITTSYIVNKAALLFPKKKI